MNKADIESARQFLLARGIEPNGTWTFDEFVEFCAAYCGITLREAEDHARKMLAEGELPVSRAG